MKTKEDWKKNLGFDTNNLTTWPKEELIKFIEYSNDERNLHLKCIINACIMLKNKVDYDEIYDYINNQLLTLDYNFDGSYLPDMMEYFKENNIK